jgi:hypothetical protein
MSSAAPSLYEPVNRYKPLRTDIGVVDGPFEYLTMASVRLPLPFTTRMTVVRLGNGDLFLHSPIAYDAALADELASMGRVRHLVSPNQFHYAHIGEWSRAFPDALTWASPGARRRARARGIDVQFNRDLSSSAPEEWRDDIDQTAIPGGIFGEMVFFHKRSKTLMLTDTILNLELDKLTQPWRFATRITGMYYPRGQIARSGTGVDTQTARSTSPRTSSPPCYAPPSPWPSAIGAPSWKMWPRPFKAKSSATERCTGQSHRCSGATTIRPFLVPSRREVERRRHGAAPPGVWPDPVGFQNARLCLALLASQAGHMPGKPSWAHPGHMLGHRTGQGCAHIRLDGAKREAGDLSKQWSEFEYITSQSLEIETNISM